MRATLIALLVVTAVLAAHSPLQKGKKVAVLLDSHDIRQTHSQYFRSLTGRGYELSFFLATDPSLELRRYGEWIYDHVVLFAPSTSEFGGTDVDAQTFLDFIDDGHCMVIAGSSNIGEPIRDIAQECGIEFDDQSSAVVDHLNFDSSDSDGEHSVIVADGFNTAASVITGTKPSAVLWRGVGHRIDEDPAGLLIELISASSTAYSRNAADKASTLIGKDISLVTALQARNNARVIFSGSLDLFSDEFFGASTQRASDKKGTASGNAAFAEQITSWAFQERAVLKHENIVHHRAGEKEEPSRYRVEDEVEYHVTIKEWVGDKWVPYQANDVQLDFVMLDPYVRLNMQHDKAGVFTSKFKIPDVYGIFQFKVGYKKLGYSNLAFTTQVSVVPFRHNEYERFIISAYPYYASAFSMLAGFVLFSIVFLHHRDQK